MPRSFAGPEDRQEANQESQERESADHPPGSHKGLGHSEQEPIEKKEGEFDKVRDDQEEERNGNLEAKESRQIPFGRLFPKTEPPGFNGIGERECDCVSRHKSNQENQCKAVNVVIRLEAFHGLQSNCIPSCGQEDAGTREDPGMDLMDLSVVAHKV